MSAGPGADSAGVPWGGRALTSTGFDEDDGTADPALLAALEAYAAGRLPDEDLFAHVEPARLLVPVVAVAGETATGEDGLVHDRSVDMAAVTLLDAEGRRAQPAFTSLAALGLWDASARPVPVTAARAAQAAVTEQCEVLVVDPGSPHEVELRPSMLWALAQQRAWLPAHGDPFVDRAVAAATAPEEAVTAYALEAGDPRGTLALTLTLAPGLAAEEVRALATRVGERLATDGELRSRVDGLAFRIR